MMNRIGPLVRLVESAPRLRAGPAPRVRAQGPAAKLLCLRVARHPRATRHFRLRAAPQGYVHCCFVVGSENRRAPTAWLRRAPSWSLIGAPKGRRGGTGVYARKRIPLRYCGAPTLAAAPFADTPQSAMRVCRLVGG